MSTDLVLRKAYIFLRDARDWIIATWFFAFIGFLKLFSTDFAINMTERFARGLGMLYPRTKLARTNLKLAFPEKSDEEIENILRDMWGNLGRTAAEYIYLDKMFDFDAENPENGRVEIVGGEHFEKLRDTKGAAVCFTAHTGNWEILPVGAAAVGVNITALFRPPNNRFIAKHVLAARTTSMGHTVPSKAGASWALANVLEDGGKVGLLVDQFFHRGTLVDFLGRETLANPLLAKLTRQYDCPVFPARTIRLPNGRFRLEIEAPIDVPYLPNGRVDVDKLTAKVNEVVEGWVREYPEQWLWLHKRWRPEFMKNWHEQKQKKRR
ncbi:MAG: lipid A biosynthesis lauroyl acyltransferase [Rhizobiaceae bacterium]